MAADAGLLIDRKTAGGATPEVARSAKHAVRRDGRIASAPQRTRRAGSDFTPVVHFGRTKNGRPFRRRATLLATPTFEAAK
jgi:hypothetical protein